MAIGARMRLVPILKSGVRYERERRSRPDAPEQWQLADTLLRTRRGDCEDIATYEVARLRLLGVDARVYLEEQGDGHLWHVMCALPDGRIYDPCRGLGM